MFILDGRGGEGGIEVVLWIRFDPLLD